MNPRGKIISKIISCHRHGIYIAVFFLFLLTNTANAQSSIDTAKRLNTQKTYTDTGIANRITDTSAKGNNLADSTLTKKQSDSTQKADSVAKRNSLDSLGIKISPDALPAVVTADASDSAVLNIADNIFELYGSAQVKYEDMRLDAHQVSYRQSSNIVTAALSLDSAIAAKGKPTFTQGQEKFTYDSLQYNFKSKRAIVRNARSQYGEGYVNSQQVKRNPDQSIYGSRSVYTTCALEHPHFGISARKIKIIPGRVVASGPANITLEDVPTPLFLPFGLFPISQGQRSGFKIPTYSVDDRWGLGLLDGGYYFAISDKVDLLAQGKFYSRGSWGADLLSSYANRYHYSGNLIFRYGYNKIGESYESNSSVSKDFNIQWTHRSDPKSRPGVNFSASVDAGTATFNANNTYTSNQILQNQYQSNITFSKQWQNKPHILSASARHSQNTQTRLVNVTLPEITFSTQFNPFQNKKSVGVKWYDKITIPYTFSAINQTSFYDSSFSFDKLSMTDFSNGMVHTIPVSASYNLVRFINVTIHSTYKEYWLTKRMYRHYNANTDKLDTTLYRGFYTARDFDAGIDFNTRIYGMKMFKKGKLAGIRHVLTPSIGFGYLPDYAAAPFNYGYKTTLSAGAQPGYVSVYEGNVPAIPGFGQFGKPRSAIGFGIDNNLQIKTRTDKDSTGFKNLRIIDNFKIGSAYDITADSFNLSNFSLNFSTMLFNVINVSANASYDPYAFDYSTGRRLKETHWDVNHGLARFQNANISLGGSLRPKQKENKPAEKNGFAEQKNMMQYGQYNDYTDFSIPFNLNFSYVLGITKQYSAFSKSDTVVLSQHNLGLQGEINITSRWNLMVSTSYDFNSKQLQMTSIDITRDLHCWVMKISTVPFGTRKFYNFTLQVKASVLQDLKLSRRRDFRDALY